MECFKNEIFYVFILLFASCVNDIDFDQAEDLQLNPIVEANVFYGTITASDFVDSNGGPVVVVQDYYDVELFDDEFIVDNLIKAEMFFEFTNSIATDLVLHTVLVNLLSGTLVAPMITTHTELFENTTLEALKQTNRIAVVLTLPDGTIVAQDGASLVMKSKGTFYMNVTTN